jgi:hypothetical protein
MNLILNTIVKYPYHFYPCLEDIRTHIHLIGAASFEIRVVGRKGGQGIIRKPRQQKKARISTGPALPDGAAAGAG